MDEIDQHDTKIMSCQYGTVVANDDPKKLGRVKVRIDGLIEPSSDWAFPMGTLGGGTKDRGFCAIPKVGAEVWVFFVLGDIGFPVYLPGHWTIGEREINIDQPSLQYGDNKITWFEDEKKTVIETKHNKISLDDNNRKIEVSNENNKVVLDDAANSITVSAKIGSIAIDGNTGSISINGVTNISIRSSGSLSLDAPATTINGRVVLNSGPPI